MNDPNLISCFRAQTRYWGWNPLIVDNNRAKTFHKNILILSFRQASVFCWYILGLGDWIPIFNDWLNFWVILKWHSYKFSYCENVWEEGTMKLKVNDTIIFNSYQFLFLFMYLFCYVLDGTLINFSKDKKLNFLWEQLKYYTRACKKDRPIKDAKTNLELTKHKKGDIQNANNSDCLLFYEVLDSKMLRLTLS